MFCMGFNLSSSCFNLVYSDSDFIMKSTSKRMRSTNAIRVAISVSYVTIPVSEKGRAALRAVAKERVSGLVSSWKSVLYQVCPISIPFLTKLLSSILSTRFKETIDYS